MIVYVVMTSGPTMGGTVYQVTKSLEDAKATLQGLQPGAFIIPWELGARKYDPQQWSNFDRVITQGEVSCNGGR